LMFVMNLLTHLEFKSIIRLQILFRCILHILKTFLIGLALLANIIIYRNV